MHTWITSRSFYLFCFFHLFPRNLAGLSRRWYDARPSRCTLESVSSSESNSSFSLSKLFETDCSTLPFVIIILYIYRLVFPLSFNYRNRERINNALQLNSPSSKRSRLFIHLTDYLNTRPSFHSLDRSVHYVIIYFSQFSRIDKSIRNLKRVKKITGPAFLTSSNDLWKRYRLVSILCRVCIANNLLLSLPEFFLAWLVVHVGILMRNIVENLRCPRLESTNF